MERHNDIKYKLKNLNNRNRPKLLKTFLALLLYDILLKPSDSTTGHVHAESCVSFPKDRARPPRELEEGP